MYVENGVVFAVYWSGNIKQALALGPSLVLQGIELGKRALAQGSITPLVRRKRVAAPGAH